MVLRPSLKTPGNLRLLVGMETIGVFSWFTGWAPELRFQPLQLLSHVGLILMFNVLPPLFFTKAMLSVGRSVFVRTNLLGISRSWRLEEFQRLELRRFDSFFLGANGKSLFRAGTLLWEADRLRAFAEAIVAQRDGGTGHIDSYRE